MRKLISVVLLLASTTSVAALDVPMDMMVPEDSRIKLLPFDETDVYTITTKPGYQTNIVFGRAEEIQTISVGDRSLWQIIPAGNRMFIRPLNEDIMTNMTVITNRRSYQFDLKSIPVSEKEGNIYVAKFVYPDTKPTASVTPSGTLPYGVMPSSVPSQMYGPPAPVVQHPPAAPVMPPPAPPGSLGSIKVPYSPPPCVPPECIPPGAKDTVVRSTPSSYDGPGITHPVGPNFNYTYSGPDDLAPVQVYDDGKSTYIRYRMTSEPLPNIYLVDPNGKERPTTYYLKGDAMVVDNVSSQMVLKSSSGIVHIYNELLSPQ